MTVFYLIRHAHADWAVDEHRPLSVRGHRAARRVADLLCESPITRIYSSPFERAWQTVAPLSVRLDLPIRIEPDLRERELGDESGLGDFFAVVKQTWQDPSCALPGGEANADAQRRGVAVVQRLMERYPGEHLVLSTHGNLLALVLQHYDLRFDYAFWKTLTMPDIYQLDLSKKCRSVISRVWQE